MTLRLSPKMLLAAYEYLRATPPVNGWKLPPADEVEFRVVHHKKNSGWWCRRTAKEDEGHIIAIAANRLSNMNGLLNTMAHEMIHLYQSAKKSETRTDHIAEFAKLMTRVCRVHGFEEMLF